MRAASLLLCAGHQGCNLVSSLWEKGRNLKALFLQNIKFSALANKGLVSPLFLIILCIFSISLAFADHDNDHGRGGRGGREGGREGWHGNNWGHGYQPGYQPYYNYAQPVYVPPPVYYQPQRSPGIDLFFPLNIHR